MMRIEIEILQQAQQDERDGIGGEAEAEEVMVVLIIIHQAAGLAVMAEMNRDSLLT